MSDTELYFRTVEDFEQFSKGLILEFPELCTDKLGNTCTSICVKVSEITTSVDKREIDGEEAIRQAQHAAQEMGCTFRLSEPKGPAIGVCGRFAVFKSV